MAAILVTGAAGFIGFHLCQELLRRGETVVGLDNLNTYYDVTLKEARLSQLLPQANFRLQRLDLADRSALNQVFATAGCDRVIHLAAQAGVRHSLENPHAYVDSNLVGFVNILEGCRHQGIQHLVFASSSSVYGGNTKIPFAVDDPVDHPVSLYAATKRANELMAYTYSHLYGLPTTGLRFFTVYGPWGRPDMAYFSFTQAIAQGQPIKVFNQGQMQRDFTYIDDIVEGIIRVLHHPPQAIAVATTAQTDAKVPARLYNIGNHQPVALLQFIEILERCLGRSALKEFLPMQPGDVVATYADVDALMEDVGFQPKTPIEVGLQRFVDWYQGYYG
ncbi:NAD-dependent epimerase [Prochlorothrix hollandica]|uniref:Capsular biosynthesis protein CpsI n=1 Tax=Prochlorothrix hollandica PCC 9006 = CALU 1027 TaxID=317619 RepID=A0A0M2Q046_PROHO|nr:NAD-dependent epimerase [Prochlorothrix hollandica]KKJ00688.1 capsular biosynthesis protein CpsI [Prochlorothrix hollandica PCC 9006 = CALU 1027]